MCRCRLTTLPPLRPGWGCLKERLPAVATRFAPASPEPTKRTDVAPHLPSVSSFLLRCICVQSIEIRYRCSKAGWKRTNGRERQEKQRLMSPAFVNAHLSEATYLPTVAHEIKSSTLMTLLSPFTPRREKIWSHCSSESAWLSCASVLPLRWCWNWQTGMVEGHVPQGVWVQLPPSALTAVRRFISLLPLILRIMGFG